MVPLLILNPLDRELPLDQTFVASGVPHLPARWPTAVRFAEVCAEYPLHPLHWRGALGAIAAPVPPKTALSKGPRVPVEEWEWNADKQRFVHG